ncbi:DsbA family protein [Blastococcus xanthinilyticus]|uniref:Protein-disulfide isomerase n=1 Tax=Blastococcus xanthinilyticus TaxID=1564164 RepID=A0A5S5CV30_9ACTN|nr:thioredoxin domain-containing protein [Blastococcus xanthinilyticus]TYP86934.1 protein-disulfide isomerase [Blastococcus xanthinilyticus]
MTGDAKREAARRRIAEQRAAEAAARATAGRRQRTLLGSVVAAVVVVVVVGVVIAVQTGRSSTAADAPVPAGTVADGTAIPVGEADAPVTVDVYEDFQCPFCAQLEAATGRTLEQLAADGDALVRYRPVAFLDHASADEYSTRALNAAGVVLDAAGVDAFVEFHGLLFGDQPAEGGPGLSDDQLVEYAARAGATGAAVEEGIRDLRFADWTERVTEAWSQAGITSTPTVLVDGTALEPAQLTADGLAAAVAAAG